MMQYYQYLSLRDGLAIQPAHLLYLAGKTKFCCSFRSGRIEIYIAVLYLLKLEKRLLVGNLCRIFLNLKTTCCIGKYTNHVK